MFTHAITVTMRLITTANNFYTEKGACICLQISISTLHNLGIVTKFEEPKPAKQTDVGETWNWFFLIFLVVFLPEFWGLSQVCMKYNITQRANLSLFLV